MFRNLRVALLPPRLRRLVCCVVAPCLFALSCGTSNPVAAAGERADALAGSGGDADRSTPNVLLIVVDTLRADRLPFHGCDANAAPFLASLAERSVVFERAWASSSWTVPSTASIFTSLYPIQHGVTLGLSTFKRARVRATTELELNRIPDGIETIPSFLSARGYATYAITDNPNICEQLGFQRGFDRMENFHNEGAGVVNSVLASWVEEMRAADSPWFVYLHYMDPHAPYDSHSGPDKAYAAKAIEAAVGAGVEADLARDKAEYAAEIRHMDRHLRTAFELLGVDDDTVVIFTSDHGEEFRDHGGLGHAFQLYSELIHVPLLVRDPAYAAGARRVAANVSVLDILPTLREILGAPPGEQDVGVSLVPYYRGASYRGAGGPTERVLFATRFQPFAGRRKSAVVTGRYKLIQSIPEDTRELFDLERDPGEQTNLYLAQEELSARLLALWEDFEQNAPRWQEVPVTIELDADAQETLRKLGYIGEAASE